MKSQPLSDTQQYYKNARLSGDYAQIWRNTGKCVFCDLKKKYILLEENEIVLTINLFPYTDGQLMAIPRQHISSPKQLSQTQWETIRQFNYVAKKMIKKVLEISCAGAGKSGFLKKVKISKTAAPTAPENNQPAKLDIGTP